MTALFIFSTPGTSNVQISLNFNMDTQPAWGFTGYNNERWRYSSKLPSQYSSYDFNNSYKAVVNDKEPRKQHTKYRDEYKRYKGHHDQQPIRDSRDSIKTDY